MTMKRLNKSVMALIFLVVVIFFLYGAGYYYMYHHTGWPIPLIDDRGRSIDFTKLDNPGYEVASYVYDNDGEKIGIFFDQIRDPVRIDNVPIIVKRAFIDAEDKRFYKHSGIDTVAIASASIGNILRSQGIKIWKRYGGASTITQQLVRLIYADEVADFKIRARTLIRKIKEARIAIQIEKRHPKEKILEVYLNLIWLGHGVNGIVEASRRYWGKDIGELTIKEATILASLNKYPVLYDPIFHKPANPKINPGITPEEAEKLKKEYDKKLTKEIIRLATAKDRYNWVLRQMMDNGDISQKEYNENLFQKDSDPNEELGHLRPLINNTFGYSNRMVKEFLLVSGRTEKEISYYGGLKIYTTIDSNIQKIVSEEFDKHLNLINKEKSTENKIEGAFVVIDIKSGDILALSGGSGFNETQYNRVMASRSPGSGFKPFTYAAAMEYFGYDFFDQICNCPFSMRGNSSGKRWTPKNFREDNPVPYGYIDFAIGHIRSVNLPTLWLARRIGINSVVDLANVMGVWGNPGIVRDTDGNIWLKRPGYRIKGGLVPLLPTAIGASDVNLLELANAYAIIFRNGVYLRPNLIREIVDSSGNKTIFAQSVFSKEVLSKETSIKITALMRAVTKVGTAKISMRDIAQQVACKTGTSDGPRDVSIWCGTPEIFIAIRFGHDDNRVIEIPDYMKTVSGDANTQVSGGWVAGSLARKIFDRIYSEARKKVDFSPEVETETQKLLARYK